MAYDEHGVEYAVGWVLMWVALTVALIALAFVLTFWQWVTAAALGFGVPEAVGLARHGDAYPPLTFVLRRYVPRWVTHTAVSGIFGSVAAYWLGFPRPWALGALLAAYGWLGDHFDVTYND